jgi:hypothetical protein
VGREVVIGIAFATFVPVLNSSLSWVESEISTSPPLSSVLSVRRVAGLFLFDTGSSVFYALWLCCAFVLLRTTLRSAWFAAVVVVLVWVFLGQQFSIGDVATNAATGAIVVFLVARWGILAAIASLIVSSVLLTAPLTLHVNAWFSGVSSFAMGVVAFMTACAAYISVASRPTPSARQS